jgi:hypothetical protein
VGVPPAFEGVAVNVTFVPEHIVVEGVAIATVGNGFTRMITIVEIWFPEMSVT